MNGNGQAAGISDSLSRRVASLADLHSRGIVTGELLGRQLMKLLSSPEAKELYGLAIDPDSRALRILHRLQDPSGWRVRSGMPREERLSEFISDLEAVMGSGEPPEEKLMRMLSLSCLPFYKGFIAPRSTPGEKAGKPSSRVSVLD